MVKDKIMLYGVGNEKDFNFYIFDKKMKIYNILKNLFREIFGIEWSMVEDKYDENDQQVKVYRNIEKIKDSHEHPEIGKIGENRIDIFYGEKRMFICIHCSNELRLKFNRRLKKIVNMPEILEPIPISEGKGVEKVEKFE